MIKVLWLSGTQLNTNSSFFFETWLSSMAKLLVDSGKVELYNMVQGKVKHTVKVDDTEIKEWILPMKSSKRTGLPPSSIMKEIEGIVNSIRPDIVHIWGMERNWGLLTPYGILGENVLLEIQGVKYACGKVYYGGLTAGELLSTMRIQEIVFPSRFLYFVKQQFMRWGAHEEAMLKTHSHIGTLSEWVRNHVKYHNRNAVMHRSMIALREEFVNPESWKKERSETDIVLMASSSFAIPYKGMHVILDVVRLLKVKYPNIKLKIAGDWRIDKPFYRKSGYLKWFVSKAKRLGVFDSLEFLGPLNASELLSHFHTADVYIVPTFVESYCLALAEAMAVGIPCVASYVGGMVELADDNESALFFQAGDYFACAGNIERILSDRTLAMKMSESSRGKAQGRNAPISVLKRQLEIYEEMMAHEVHSSEA